MRRHGPEVPPDGPDNATLCYLFQNPGAIEEKLGYGMAGPSGVKLWQFTAQAGLPSRTLVKDEKGKITGRPGAYYAKGAAGDAFVCNTVPVRYYQGNHLTNDLLDVDVRDWTGWLQETLPSTLKVIVAGGTPACQAVATGYYPDGWRSVLQHAGTVIPPDLCRGFVKHNAFVIPVPHTAFILAGQDQYYPLFRRAMRRVEEVWRTGVWSYPEPAHKTLWAGRQHFDDVIAAAKAQGWVSIDIETPRRERPTQTILLVSFSTLSSGWVMSGADGTKLVQMLVDLGIKIVGQNWAAFDGPVFSRNGVNFPPEWWRGEGLEDTLWGDAVHRPRMPHRLHQLASWWLPEGTPCWKHVGGSSDPDVEREYCMRDSWHGGRIHHNIMERAKRLDLVEAFDARRDLMPVVWEMSLKGVRVDLPARQKLRQQCNDLWLKLDHAWHLESEKWAAPKRARAAREMLGVEDTKLNKKNAEKEAKAVLKCLEKQIVEFEKLTGFNDGGELYPAMWKCHEKQVVYMEEAKLSREAAQKDLVRARAFHDRFVGGIGPKQTELVKEWLYFDKDGLRLPVQKHPKTKKPTLDRRLLAQLAVTKEGKKHPELYILSGLNRLQSVMALHAGLRVREGAPRLDWDPQLYCVPGTTTYDHLGVSMHPVQMRMASGRGESVDEDLIDPTAVQLQNAPKRFNLQAMGIEETLNFRLQHVADFPGMKLVTADYSSMEDYIWYWAMGHFIGWWDGLKMLYEGVDLHAETANSIWPDCPATKAGSKKFMVNIGGVSLSARDRGKMVHHAFKLGGGARMLKHNQAIPEGEGKKLLASMASTPRGQKIREFQEWLGKEALRDFRAFTEWNEFVDYWGVKVNWKGEARLADESKVYAVKQQGNAAMILIRALPRVYWAMKENIKDGRVILPIHDEIVTQAWPDQTKLCADILQREMELPWPNLPVPWAEGGLSIPAEPTVVEMWGEAA